MGQVAFTLDQQITLLTEREMNFEGYTTEKIKEVLGDIGYYRLGFYWHDFFDSVNEKFLPNTKFSTIVDLYYLDHDIRYTLIKYLHRIEVNFRTQLIYFASNKYKNNNAWFADPLIMTQSFIDELPNHYNDRFKSDYPIIKKHHNKYECEYAPAWKTLEHFPFGAVFKIYTNLIDVELKQRISLKYDLRNTDKFENIMNKVVHIRNRCSHGALLYNYNLKKSFSKIPQLDFTKDSNLQSLNAVIKYTAFVLKSISINRYNSLNTDIQLILNQARSHNVDSYTIFCEKASIPCS